MKHHGMDLPHSVVGVVLKHAEETSREQGDKGKSGLKFLEDESERRKRLEKFNSLYMGRDLKEIGEGK